MSDCEDKEHTLGLEQQKVSSPHHEDFVQQSCQASPGLLFFPRTAKTIATTERLTRTERYSLTVLKLNTQNQCVARPTFSPDPLGEDFPLTPASFWGPLVLGKGK